MTTLTLLLLFVCAIGVLAVLGVGGFLVLLKLGVIVRKASRPAAHDLGGYRTDRGREVRPEDERA